MTRRDIAQHIAVTPLICSGVPVIRGTQIPVSDILDHLADGMNEAELLADHPELTGEDILACIAYAAAITHEREPLTAAL